MSLLVVWADGRLTGPDAQVLRADDRGALLGDGTFTTIKVRAGRALFLRAHLDRLCGGARLLGMPFPKAAILEGVGAVTEGRDEGVLRVALSRGPRARGLAPAPADAPPTILVTLAALPPAAAPASLRPVSVRRNEGSPASRHKLSSYADMILARAEAARAGGDDALVRNNAGRPVCTSVANLWARIGDEYVTPPLKDGALPGVVRRALIEAAPRAGLRVTVRSLDLTELRGAPLFRSNSLLGLAPCALPGGPIRGDDPLARLYAECEEEECAASR